MWEGESDSIDIDKLVGLIRRETEVGKRTPAGSQEAPGQWEFLVVGPASERQQVGTSTFESRSATGFSLGPPGQGVRRVGGKRAVEQAERLRGDRGHGTFGAARVRIRPVEGLEERIAQVATDEDIEAPAIVIRDPCGDGPDRSLARQPGQLGGAGAGRRRGRRGPGSAGPRPTAGRRGSPRRRAGGDSGPRASGSRGRPRARPPISAATTGDRSHS